MRKVKCVILIALAMLMSSSSHAHAGLVTERETMRGIEGIYVTTEVFSSGNEKYGLSKEKVQKDVVLKLQMAGVKVIALKDLLTVSGLPWLHVRIDYVNNHPDVACHITVELLQEVSLKRNLDVTCFAKTWSIINRRRHTTWPSFQSVSIWRVIPKEFT